MTRTCWRQPLLFQLHLLTAQLRANLIEYRTRLTEMEHENKSLREKAYSLREQLRVSRDFSTDSRQHSRIN
jgi:hypothetical protein